MSHREKKKNGSSGKKGTEVSKVVSPPSIWDSGKFDYGIPNRGNHSFLSDPLFFFKEERETEEERKREREKERKRERE